MSRGSFNSILVTQTYFNKLAPSMDPNSIYRSYRMTGPLIGEGSGNDRETPPMTSEHIYGHITALRSLVKEHNRKNTIDPIRMNLDEEDTTVGGTNIIRGKTVEDVDLKKPFKEALRTPLTRMIIKFASLEYKRPTNIKLYDGSIDLEDHLNRFSSAPNSGEWPMPVW
uniref:Reverse transcriptase domain-containing protein n=1 Tax=Tanacetum cinerariifolium TaxID=118510 RepID=A0A699HZX1_TANCI|nr:hypothetical protein [Tanacetum cinerariifolium]